MTSRPKRKKGGQDARRKEKGTRGRGTNMYMYTRQSPPTHRWAVAVQHQRQSVSMTDMSGW